VKKEAGSAAGGREDAVACGEEFGIGKGMRK
jgi:hypothetical protein